MKTDGKSASMLSEALAAKQKVAAGVEAAKRGEEIEKRAAALESSNRSGAFALEACAKVVGKAIKELGAHPATRGRIIAELIKGALYADYPFSAPVRNPVFLARDEDGTQRAALIAIAEMCLEAVNDPRAPWANTQA